MSGKLSRVMLITIVVVAFGRAADAATWARQIGGPEWDGFMGMTRVTSGEIVGAGATRASSTVQPDGWVVKMNVSGSVVWQQAIGGAGTDVFFGASATSDGGCVLVGLTSSFSASADAWVVRLDAAGGVVWQRFYGGSSSDWFRTVVATSDGGFLVGGATSSFGGGAWALKLTSAGDIQWQQRYASSGLPEILEVAQTNDGRFIAIGRREVPGGSLDAWVIKINGLGGVVWERTIGGSGYDQLNGLSQLQDNSYMIVGGTTPSGSGDSDAWLVRFSEAGSLLWNRTLGDANSQSFYDIAQISGTAGDEEFVVSGYWDGDTFLGRVDRDGSWHWLRRHGRSVSHDPGSVVAEAPDGGFFVTGDSEWSGGDDAWALKTDATGGLGSTCGLSQNLSATQTTPTTFVSTSSSSVVATTSAATPSWAAASSTGWTDSFFCAGSSGPTITSVKSKAAKPGTQASIKGSGFSATAKKNTVYFGTKKAKIKKAKSTLLKVTIPKGLPKGPVDVHVVVDGVTSNVVSFTVK